MRAKSVHMNSTKRRLVQIIYPESNINIINNENCANWKKLGFNNFYLKVRQKVFLPAEFHKCAIGRRFFCNFKIIYQSSIYTYYALGQNKPHL
jgi:hypothetical protein